jgi:hypothetical protein
MCYIASICRLGPQYSGIFNSFMLTHCKIGSAMAVVLVLAAICLASKLWHYVLSVAIYLLFVSFVSW